MDSGSASRKFRSAVRRLCPNLARTVGIVAAFAFATIVLRPVAEGGRGWPFRSAELVPRKVPFPPAFGVRRIFLDAGHGAPKNSGNVSCQCEDEQDFTLRVAGDLARRLEATGHFEVRLSRQGDRLVDYPSRVEEATREGAEAFLSLHSDVRGVANRWSPSPGKECPVSFAAPGFAVLYSEEGPADHVLLARAMADRLEQVGFLPYAGALYGGLYARDRSHSGAFADHHPLEQRIFVLRRPSMRAVLIETHHALDPLEVERWKEEGTLAAFASAVASALVDTLAP